MDKIIDLNTSEWSMNMKNNSKNIGGKIMQKGKNTMVMTCNIN